MKIRNVKMTDVERICEIYNYYIQNTTITFETEPLTVDEMLERVAGILSNGYPYYVCEENGKVLGYCYLHQWSARRAYRSSVEDSIYVDKEYTGKGIGRMSMQYMMNNIDRTKYHTIVAGICLPNEASIGLHERFGFRQISTFKEIGNKFGKWLDVGHWQVIL